MNSIRDKVWGTIFDLADALDKEQFVDFVGLCAPEFKYRICTYSPELRKDMVLMEQTREELASLFTNLSQHVRMIGSFSRQLAVGKLSPAGEDQKKFIAISPFTVYYTDIEGVSRVYAVGRYIDRLHVAEEQVLLEAREVRLDTRDLSPGCHVPL